MIAGFRPKQVSMGSVFLLPIARFGTFQCLAVSTSEAMSDNDSNSNIALLFHAQINNNNDNNSFQEG
jgi:hypothetical protein